MDEERALTGASHLEEPLIQPTSAETDQPQSISRTATVDGGDGLPLQASGDGLPLQASGDGLPLQASGGGGGTSLAGSVVLLSKAIVGAGAAALPLAFARLGILVSITFLLSVAFLTHFSLQALSLGIVTSGRASYPAAVRSLLGPRSASVLELCLVLRCAGLIIVYIVIAADLLAGSPSLPGLICEISPTLSWCADRHIIGGIITLGAVVPLVTPKRLSSATFTSFLGLAAVALWTVVTMVVAGAAIVTGKATFPGWLPDSTALGGGTVSAQTVAALATLPVIATAFTCQMTVAFIIGELRQFTVGRMSTVSAAAVTLCSGVFLIVGLGSIVAFGAGNVPADILELFSKGPLTDLIQNPIAAAVLGVSVRLAFLVSILANMPIQMLPYRQSLARLLFGSDQEFSSSGYFLTTYASVAVFYLVAMAARSIWVPIQLVGATAGAAIAFFFPGAIAFAAVTAAQQRRGATALFETPWYWNGSAWGLIVLGLVQMVTGVAAVLLGH